LSSITDLRPEVIREGYVLLKVSRRVAFAEAVTSRPCALPRSSKSSKSRLPSTGDAARTCALPPCEWRSV